MAMPAMGQKTATVLTGRIAALDRQDRGVSGVADGRVLAAGTDQNVIALRIGSTLGCAGGAW
jgi:hypothetical protein